MTPTAALKPVTFWNDSFSTCLNRTNIQESDYSWVAIPASASELYSEEDFFFLAGQMIKSGAVDASACPAGGLGAKEGYANACGMSVARDVVVEYQNAYNEYILQAWREVGVPPLLLKKMIKIESQFYAKPWESAPSYPGGGTTYHVGLGHLTYLGARNALLWNQNLYQEVCSLNASNCDPLYVDSLASTLIDLMDASCSTCEHNLDLAKAQNSIHYQAEVMLAYCNQTAQVVYNATKMHSSYLVDYATIWKLTLMTYNVGPQCTLDAIRGAYDQTQGPFRWEHVVAHVSDPACFRGVNYANQITE